MPKSVFGENFFWFEVLALAVSLGVVIFKRDMKSPFRTVVLYMAFIVAFEIIANMYRKDRILVIDTINRVVIPVEFLYMMFLGYFLLRSQKLRKWVLAAVAIYLLLFVKDLAFPSVGRARLLVTSYIAGVLGLTLVCAVLYYELLNSPRLEAFYREPVFWFFTGMLIFYLGTLPMHLYWNLASSRDVQLLIKLQALFNTLMCIMYVFFSVSMLSLLWKKD
jgi:hypothetical protein